MTYGDGVADVPVDEVLAFHEEHGKLATVTAVRPPSRFGALTLEDDRVTTSSRSRRPRLAGSTAASSSSRTASWTIWPGDDTILEREPLEQLAHDGQLMAYRHDGFWEPMDTERDRTNLVNLWASGEAPWKVWDD